MANNDRKRLYAVSTILFVDKPRDTYGRHRQTEQTA